MAARTAQTERYVRPDALANNLRMVGVAGRTSHQAGPYRGSRSQSVGGRFEALDCGRSNFLVEVDVAYSKRSRGKVITTERR